jgi:nucleotide-binding universal stress UspA family protein
VGHGSAEPPIRAAGDLTIVPGTGPVIFAYDGSDTAAFAIEGASSQLGSDREAIVACVWRPVDVCFKPVPGRRFRACVAKEVERAAHETAAVGVDLARRHGFRACARTIEAAPTFRGLITLADEWECPLIVLGSSHRSGVLGPRTGSVAGATVKHFPRSVLVIRKPDDVATVPAATVARWGQGERHTRGT